MTHLSDEQLLMFQDGELVDRHAKRAGGHLRTCAQCRERLGTMRLLADEIQELPQRAATPRPFLRVRLQRVLEESSASNRLDWWQRSPMAMFFKPSALMRVGAVAALLLTLVWGTTHFSRSGKGEYAAIGPEPNPLLTPGATNSVALPDVCSWNDHDLDPTVSTEKQRAVFKAYGISETAAKAYQMDYLINPQLGGSDALENLWPEPYRETVWNASVKDALEKKLHGMVCSQQIDLKEAQRELATDWIGAYKKYFHASSPASTTNANLDVQQLSRTRSRLIFKAAKAAA